MAKRRSIRLSSASRNVVYIQPNSERVYAVLAHMWWVLKHKLDTTFPAERGATKQVWVSA